MNSYPLPASCPCGLASFEWAWYWCYLIAQACSSFFSHSEAYRNFAACDQELIDRWKDALSADFKGKVHAALKTTASKQFISFEVKRAINAEISERSRHMLRSVEELIDLSADGFMHATGLDHSDDIFGGVPRSSSDVLTLDVAPQVFDAGSMALGHVRMPGLNPRDWKDLGTVVDACARPLLLDRSLVIYTRRQPRH